MYFQSEYKGVNIKLVYLLFTGTHGLYIITRYVKQNLNFLTSFLKI